MKESCNPGNVGWNTHRSGRKTDSIVKDGTKSPHLQLHLQVGLFSPVTGPEARTPKYALSLQISSVVIELPGGGGDKQGSSVVSLNRPLAEEFDMTMREEREKNIGRDFAYAGLGWPDGLG